MAQINETISVDYDALHNMSNGFKGTSEAMRAVAQALEVAIGILKDSALFGMPGNAALAFYLEGIKPNVERLAVTCNEMAVDLEATVQAFEAGDTSGSAKFNK